MPQPKGVSWEACRGGATLSAAVSRQPSAPEPELSPLLAADCRLSAVGNLHAPDIRRATRRMSGVVDQGLALLLPRAATAAVSQIQWSDGGINNKVGVLKHRAYGFHSAAALIALVYLRCAHRPSSRQPALVMLSRREPTIGAGEDEFMAELAAGHELVAERRADQLALPHEAATRAPATATRPGAMFPICHPGAAYSLRACHGAPKGVRISTYGRRRRRPCPMMGTWDRVRVR